MARRRAHEEEGEVLVGEPPLPQHSEHLIPIARLDAPVATAYTCVKLFLPPLWLLVHLCISFGCLCWGVSTAIETIDAETWQYFSKQTRVRLLFLVGRHVFGESSLRLWLLWNFLSCLVMTSTFFVQVLLFGQLSADELNAARSRLMSFFFLRLILILAILDSPVLDLLIWCTWFALQGVFRYLTALSHERFRSFQMDPAIGRVAYFRALASSMALVVVISASTVWCGTVFWGTGAVLPLLLYENGVLLFDALQTLLKNSVHIASLFVEEGHFLHEERASLLFYVEFGTMCATHILTLLELLHIWLLYGISFTFIDLFLIFTIRSAFVKLRDQFRMFRQYRLAVQEMRTRYPDALESELAEHNDHCAICLHSMTTAKKLPCGHLFHASCLRQWLKYRRICPLCRQSLLQPAEGGGEGAPAPEAPQGAPQQRVGFMRSVFQFNTAHHFLTSWLPNFQFHFIRAEQQVPAAAQAQLQDIRRMLLQHAHGIAAAFPGVPVQAILADLATTRSADQTVENILAGRLAQPAWQGPRQPEHEQDAAAHEEAA